MSNKDSDQQAKAGVKSRRISRRAWMRMALYGTPIVAAGTAFGMEPHWLRVRRVNLPAGLGRRVVHFTDTHHKGDAGFLNRVVDTVNAQEPDLICFTGDIMEDAAFLDEALRIFARLKAPMFGVPGNHEYWSGAPFAPIRECFARTGGAWLVDECVDHEGMVIAGRARRKPTLPGGSKAPVLALTHYPLTAEEFTPGETALILAGHSHGGQVRIPFYGAPLLPGQVGPYDMGLFERDGWRLYVNPGIGTWQYPVRLFCRPEITVFEG